MKVNPIDLEIIRHRMETITADAGDTLARVSGSQISSEAGDYNTALMDASGQVLSCSKSVVVQSTSLNLIVTDILETLSGFPGISEQDQFITNDPFVGSLHQPDVTIVAPIFAQGQLIGWAGCTVHVADIGGPVGGGFNQAARSIFDEPLPITPVKLVEGGRIRPDIRRDILRRSRSPELNALDMMGQIAANREASQQVLKLVERYGLETIVAAQRSLLDGGASAFRERLSALPDGTWQEQTYLQHERLEGESYHPNAIYTVRLTMTKSGDRLIFDFSESDPQAPGAINSGFPALANFVMASVLVQLCQEMPWIPGAIWQVIEIRSTPGTIVHAEWPAGVAMSTGTSAQAIRNVACACIARMLDGSDSHAHMAMALSQSTGAGGMSISGRHANGQPFHTLFLDELTGGGGASMNRDGPDVAGTISSVGALPANVETNEAAFPVLYMQRRELPDSAGPGRQRGGTGIIWSYRPHRAGSAMAINSMAQGLQHPTTMGILGGEPGVASALTIAGTDTRDWEHAIASSVMLSLPTAQDAVDQHTGLVMASSQGGGGLGDPLDRNPQAVLSDWSEGLVTAAGALRDYGVVIGGDGLKLTATAEARTAQRRERLQGREPVARTATLRGKRISTHFSVADGEVLCSSCGTTVCTVEEPIIASLASRETSAGYRFAPTDLYPGSERFRVRFFYCPGCATQVDVQVVKAGDQSNETTQIAASKG